MLHIQIVKLSRGGIGAEVPGGTRGQIVAENSSHQDDGRQHRGLYRLTSRVTAGTDFWHLREANQTEPEKRNTTGE